MGCLDPSNSDTYSVGGKVRVRWITQEQAERLLK